MNQNIHHIQKLVAEFRKENPVKKKRPSGAGRVPWKKRAPEEFEAAKILWSEKRSIRSIAKHFKITYETVRKTFEREGIKNPTERKPRPTAKIRRGTKVDPGQSCPCGVGMHDICTVHKWRRI